MPSSRFDEARDYAFGDQALALRKRAGLTQRDLATVLHVNVQSIHGWENGRFYPGTEHLQRLIALYLERGVLTAGREEAEAEALWARARRGDQAHRTLRPGLVRPAAAWAGRRATGAVPPTTTGSQPAAAGLGGGAGSPDAPRAQRGTGHARTLGA